VPPREWLSVGLALRRARLGLPHCGVQKCAATACAIPTCASCAARSPRPLFPCTLPRARPFPHAPCAAPPLPFPRRAGTRPFPTQSYYLSLYFDCPPGMGLTCPTPAEKAAARAAIVAGDITYHAFPHNAELENTNEAMLREGLRLSHALDEVSGYARGWCVFVCVWMIELCAVMCARCISTLRARALACACARACARAL
jgi:hypothetical protein